LAAEADVLLVAPDRRHPRITYGLTAVLPDKDGQIARAYKPDQPPDGGYPVGYVLVDSAGFVRYKTLDPHCVGMGHNYEIKALLRAIQ
jgi:alkyl hydroperoxide reductase subunit AhpC